MDDDGQSYLKSATLLAKKAVSEDIKGNYESAFDLYSRACTAFMKYIKEERNDSMKAQIKQKVSEYLDRAEALRPYCRSKDMTEASPDSISKSVSNLRVDDDNILPPNFIGGPISLQTTIESATDIFRKQLFVFMDNIFKDTSGQNWIVAEKLKLSQDCGDLVALLTILWRERDGAFKNVLDLYDKTLISEVRYWRNEASQNKINTASKAFRYIDTLHILLQNGVGQSLPSISQLAKLKQHLLSTMNNELNLS